MNKPTCVLTIGGSDSCTGAGIQADLRVLNAFGVKGCSAITALTAQNPESISRIEPAPLPQLEAEIRAIYDYYDVLAVKTGMLYDADRIRLIAGMLSRLHANKPIIVDPVMISSSGKALLDEASLGVLKDKLFPVASLITPNLPEADVLLGEKLERDTCHRLFQKFNIPVLLKSGHIRSNKLIDVLCIDDEEIAFTHERQIWGLESSHGTGCRLASAIAALLAQGNSLSVAVSRAIEWLQNPSGHIDH